ncbi:MAG: hypothetical protein Q8K01_15270 [Sulfurimicrobium sp.]|nr:hypothetical protein [Sulfurimicrobium sp.]MDP1703592.1 hypothetical protein [Sulfurimicrobium sp.]MDP2199943.1 hypothetical protein [Sulfurimicrobium sp.]
MSKIENIDVTKPLVFYGNLTKASEISLSAEETQMLLGYVGTCCWQEDFDFNLQGMTETDNGQALLTGRMPMDQFAQFVCNAGEGDPVRKILDRLQAATQDWQGMGVEEVFFDGFELSSQ